MNEQLYKDARDFPHLFIWNGPIDEKALQKLQQDINIKLPDELIDFYVKTNGGELFESEDILGPFAERDDNLLYMNYYYYEIGMPKHWFLFHTGILNSALDLETNEIIVFEKENFEVEKKYRSFSDWYSLFIRDEYKDRYGLN